MKRIIISKNIYKGVRSYTGKPNVLTRIFYAAKFHKNERAVRKLTLTAIKELKQIVKKNDFDYITAVNTTSSKWNLPREIAKRVGDKYDIVYLEVFKDKNIHLAVKPDKIKGKKILVIDDVIYSGKTIKTTSFLLKKAKVNLTIFYAILKSPKYKN